MITVASVGVRHIAPAVVLVAGLATSGGHSPADVGAAVRAFVTPQALEQDARRIVEHDRLSGSDGESAAIDYIVATLKGDGVPVQLQSFRAFTSDPVSASVALLGADGSVLSSPRAITVAFSASTANL